MTSFRIRPATADDIHKIGNGIRRSFDVPETLTDWYNGNWGNERLNHPHFQMEHSRVGELNGTIVSHMMVEFHQLRYGRARIRAAHIGYVYTEKGYRNRGFAARVMRDALTYAVEQGAQIALLNATIRSYFVQFGFSPIFPYYYTQFSTAEAAQLPAPLTLRPLQHKDIPQVAYLYDRHWSARVAFSRSPELWLWRMNGGDGYGVLVAVDADDSVQGYLAAQDVLSNKVEVVVDSLPAAQTMLSYIGKLYQREEHPTFSWLVPPDDVLVEYAREMLSVQVSALYEPDGGWMGRLLDIPTLINSIQPELVDQGRFAIANIKHNEVTIMHRHGGIEIGLRNKPKTYATLNQRDFVQMMFGSLSPYTLGLREHLSSESVTLLQALFPQRMTVIGAWDWL